MVNITLSGPARAQAIGLCAQLLSQVAACDAALTATACPHEQRSLSERLYAACALTVHCTRETTQIAWQMQTEATRQRIRASLAQMQET